MKSYGSKCNFLTLHPACRLHASKHVTDESWAAQVGRREFVRSMVSAFFLAALPSTLEDSLTLGILSNAPATGFDDGVRMGLSEASRAALLFARKPIIPARARDATALIKAGASVIIGSLAAEDTVRIARLCRSRRIVYLNCGSRSNELRAECNEFLFHIEASESMYANAASKMPGWTIKLWDPSLEKYGAAQLNDRFRATFNRPMDAAAWCGWLAAKVVWESLVRMKGSGAIGIRDHLLLDTAQFDGHKGAPLSFRRSDHQLRQPLYAITSGKLPQDIPDLARNAASTRDLLDSIAGPSVACRNPR